MLKFSSVLFKFISLVLGLSDMQSFPPPLSAKEETELFAKARAGDMSARGKLIEHNLRLVSHIIRKYYSSYQYPDDLLSVGSLGIMKAVDSFRTDAGVRFATYGAKCVQNEIFMYFRSKKKEGAEVSLNDTIDVDRDGNPLTYMDVISVDDTIAENLDLKMHTDRICTLVNTKLSAREQKIIIHRYGLCGCEPKTQREVASYLGISRSYVSRIEKKALFTLKAAYGDVRPDFDD